MCARAVVFVIVVYMRCIITVSNTQLSLYNVAMVTYVPLNL